MALGARATRSSFRGRPPARAPVDAAASDPPPLAAMLSLHQVEKRAGGRLLYEGVSLRIARGERWGLVGPNGSGKTTLLRILTGEEEVDAGRVARRRDLTLGYLRQEAVGAADETPLLVHTTGSRGEVAEVEAALAEVEARLAGGGSREELAAWAEEQGRLFERFQALGGFDLEARAEAILHGLGFRQADLPRPIRTLSGGWRMRAELARLLLAAPDLLLLDEPTNHLDLASVEWLEGYLKGFPGAILLISHDRTFLNHLVTKVASVEGGTVVTYRGNYDAFEHQQAERRALQAQAAANQERQIRDTERFIARFRSQANKARQVQSRIKQLARMERIEVEQEGAAVHIRFPQPPRAGRVVVELDGVDKGYGETAVYRDLSLTLQRGERIALAGPNGAGKSTLLKLLAGVELPDRGEVRLGSNVRRAYFSQHSADTLHDERTLLEEVRAVAHDRTTTELRALLGRFLFPGDAVEKRVGVLSGGERSRLALARLLVHPPNLLLLDEPTNHLDMAAREALAAALEEYTGTVVLITHDRHLLQQVAREILVVERDPEGHEPATVTLFPGDYAAYQRGRVEAARSPARPKGTKPSGRRRNREAQRRAKAEVNRLKREVGELEQALEAVMEEQSALTERLADPDLYHNDATLFDETVRRHQEVERHSAELTERWEARLAALEAAEATLAETGGAMG